MKIPVFVSLLKRKRDMSEISKPNCKFKPQKVESLIVNSFYGSSHWASRSYEIWTFPSTPLQTECPASCINTEYFSLYLAIFASYPLTRKTLRKLLFKSFQKAQIRRVNHFKRTVYRTEARCVGETITLSAKIINSFVAGVFLITYPKESKNTLSTWRIMKNYDKS